MCFVSAVYLFGRKLSVTFLTLGSESPLGIEDRDGRRLSLRPSNCRSLSLNEQVHRELRRVEAAATTDNEPTEEGREDIQSPERATAPPAAVRTLRTSAFSVNPSVRALRTRDLKFYA